MTALPRRLLTPAEAAAYLGVSLSHWKRTVFDGFGAMAPNTAQSGH